jgi:hypothetical protein
MYIHNIILSIPENIVVASYFVVQVAAVGLIFSVAWLVVG